jgi:hypothetical protein
VNFAWRPDWQPLFSNGTINKPSNNYWTGIVYGKDFVSDPGDRSGGGIYLHNSGLLLCTVWEQATRNGSCGLYGDHGSLDKQPSLIEPATILGADSQSCPLYFIHGCRRIVSTVEKIEVAIINGVLKIR